MAETYLATNVGQQATNALRADLALHCLRLDPQFHNTHTPGELIERVDGDVDLLSNFLSRFAVQVVGNVLLLGGVLVLLARVDPRFGLAFGALTVVAFAVLRTVQPIPVPYRAAARQSSAALFGFLEERLSGVEDLRANGAVAYTMRRLYERMRDLLRKERKGFVLGSATGASTPIILTLATAARLRPGGRPLPGGGDHPGRRLPGHQLHRAPAPADRAAQPRGAGPPEGDGGDRAHPGPPGDPQRRGRRPGRPPPGRPPPGGLRGGGLRLRRGQPYPAGRHLPPPGGRGAGPDRAHREREDHGVPPPLPPLRPHRGGGAPGGRRPAPGPPGGRAPAGGPGDPGGAAVPGQRAGQPDHVRPRHRRGAHPGGPASPGAGPLAGHPPGRAGHRAGPRRAGAGARGRGGGSGALRGGGAAAGPGPRLPARPRPGDPGRGLLPPRPRHRAAHRARRGGPCCGGAPPSSSPTAWPRCSGPTGCWCWRGAGWRSRGRGWRWPPIPNRATPRCCAAGRRSCWREPGGYLAPGAQPGHLRPLAVPGQRAAGQHPLLPPAPPAGPGHPALLRPAQRGRPGHLQRVDPGSGAAHPGPRPRRPAHRRHRGRDDPQPDPRRPHAQEHAAAHPGAPGGGVGAPCHPSLRAPEPAREPARESGRSEHPRRQRPRRQHHRGDDRAASGTT